MHVLGLAVLAGARVRPYGVVVVLLVLLLVLQYADAAAATLLVLLLLACWCVCVGGSGMATVQVLNSNGKKQIQGFKHLLKWQGVIDGATCAAREDMTPEEAAAFRARCEADPLLSKTLIRA